MASVIDVYVAFFFLMTIIIMPCNSGLHLGKCTDRDISITQGQGSSTGIPEYIVEIINTCLSDDCPPSNIHLHCGLFASARLVDPQLFKRLSNDDCLVNGGKPLKFASANLVNPQHFKRPSIDDCLMNGGKLLKASQLIRFSYSNRVVGSVLVEAIALIGNE
ncbi:hypothetical protein ACSBR1_013961 [Camellia fascicularis]